MYVTRLYRRTRKVSAQSISICYTQRISKMARRLILLQITIFVQLGLFSMNPTYASDWYLSRYCGIDENDIFRCRQAACINAGSPADMYEHLKQFGQVQMYENGDSSVSMHLRLAQDNFRSTVEFYRFFRDSDKCKSFVLKMNKDDGVAEQQWENLQEQAKRYYEQQKETLHDQEQKMLERYR
jgi:hypothetical protein